MVLYPFKVRITDPDLIKPFLQLSHRRAIKITDKNTLKKIGWKVQPIRHDIIIGPDHKFFRSGVSLTPEIDLEYKQPYGNKKCYDFIFKKIF